MAILRLYDRIQPMPNPKRSFVTPQSSPALPSWAASLARRNLAGPLLLFAAGHRPLAFVAGQMLHLMDPLVGLLGIGAWDREAGAWADLLSRPDGPDQLAAALEEARHPAKEGPQ